MKIPEPTGSGDFEITPEGQYTAICCRVVDLGTQETNGPHGIKQVHKIMIGWEIPDVRVKDQNGGDMPALHQERFTWSMHEKALLRKLLESWRGVKFKDADFGTFDTKTLIGVPCLMQIAHSDPIKGKSYANIQSVMRSPLKRDDWPKLEGEPIYVSIADLDEREFGKLSEYWQELIAKSPEYKSRNGSKNQQQDDGGWSRDNQMEDEIPF